MSSQRAADDATGTFDTVDPNFQSTEDAQMVMRRTHDGFRAAALEHRRRKKTHRSEQEAEESSVASAIEQTDLEAWRATAHAQQATLQTYARAQHRLAAELWQSKEVAYVLESIQSYFVPRTSSQQGNGETEDEPPKHFPCGAAAKLVKRAVNEYQEQHSGNPMPRAEYNATVDRINSVFLPPGVAHGPGAESSDTQSLPLRVLDIGSCYDPFGQHPSARDWLDVTAVDLEPSPAAGAKVHRCDWLEVELVATAEECDANRARRADTQAVIKRVQAGSFDVVIMSYLLSFLPTCELRARAIQSALGCLRAGGALIIVEARRGGHRANGWPAKWTEAIEALWDAKRIRLDLLKKSVGLIFSGGLRSLELVKRPSVRLAEDERGAQRKKLLFDSEVSSKDEQP